MKLLINKNTGLLIDSYPDVTEDATIEQNAVNYSFALIDVEIQQVEEVIGQTVIAIQPKPIIPKSQVDILQETVDQLILDSLGV
jgi:spore coat polysaccharide biosynthesis predicted glycosyltransferase SpsG